MTNKMMMGLLSFTTVLTLAACSGEEAAPSEPVENETIQEETSEVPQEQTEDSSETDHSSMNHSGSGEVPEGLKEAENPTFPVGSQVTILTDHVGGMKGAEATITGAYETAVYMVSYTPTNGGEPVLNHKWVIHEELEGVGKESLKPGAEVTLHANHMEGMMGATATIDSVEETTVYMVDFTSATGEKVTNHKWVTESEVSAP